MEGIIPIDLAIAGTLHQADDLEHSHTGTGIVAHKNWGKKKIIKLFIPDFWEIKVSLTYIKTACQGENYKIAQVNLLLQHDHQNNVKKRKIYKVKKLENCQGNHKPLP